MALKSPCVIALGDSSALVQIMGLGAGIYNPDGSSPFGYGTLVGRPLAVSEQANPLGQLGDLILVDPLGYLYALQGPRNADRTRSRCASELVREASLFAPAASRW
jgi:hypothetical protein